MASNLTQIGDAINNTNFSFTPINSTDILPNAISSVNDTSGGWVGVLVLSLMALSTIIYVIKYRQSFGLFDNLGITFVSIGIILDIGIYLLIWEILTSFDLYIKIFTVYFVICFFSQLKKDMINTET